MSDRDTTTIPEHVDCEKCQESVGWKKAIEERKETAQPSFFQTLTTEHGQRIEPALPAQVSGPHNGTQTSVDAAIAAVPLISPQKQRILRLLERHEEGLTQDEASIVMYLPRSTICARFNELERDKLIVKTQATRPTQYGKQAAVYVSVGSAHPEASVSG
jgi:hypothetical protein